MFSKRQISVIRNVQFLIYLLYIAELEGLGTASISSQGATLSHLVLSKNLLKDVPTRALKLLRNLDHLNLNDNKITALHENAFKGLSKVHIICKLMIEVTV